MAALLFAKIVGHLFYLFNGFNCRYLTTEIKPFTECLKFLARLYYMVRLFNIICIYF